MMEEDEEDEDQDDVDDDDEEEEEEGSCAIWVEEQKTVTSWFEADRDDHEPWSWTLGPSQNQ